MSSYCIDTSRSHIKFSARHVLFARTRGRFTRWTARLSVDFGDLSRSSVSASIDAGSIETGDAQRDERLRAADFLDVDRFKIIAYASRRVERTGNHKYRVTGDLTIRAATREVSLEVEE